jgi:hypothetical protein
MKKKRHPFAGLRARMSPEVQAQAAADAERLRDETANLLLCSSANATQMKRSIVQFRGVKAQKKSSGSGE